MIYTYTYTKSKKYVQIFSGLLAWYLNAQQKFSTRPHRPAAVPPATAGQSVGEHSGSKKPNTSSQERQLICGKTNSSHHPNRPSHCYPGSWLFQALTFWTKVLRIWLNRVFLGTNLNLIHMAATGVPRHFFYKYNEIILSRGSEL